MESKVDIGLFHELMEKAGFVKWHPERKEYFALISRSGFTGRMKTEAKAKESSSLLRWIMWELRENEPQKI